MAGITLEDFSQSVAYKEIFGLGEQRGRELGLEQGLEKGLEQGMEKGLEQGLEKGMEKGLEQGLKTGELEITLRQLLRRCGALSSAQQARIRELPRHQLEALAEALLDFQGTADLEAWLAAHG